MGALGNAQRTVSTRLKHKINKKSPYSATNRIGAMIHTLEVYTKEHYYYTTKPLRLIYYTQI